MLRLACHAIPGSSGLVLTQPHSTMPAIPILDSLCQALLRLPNSTGPHRTSPNLACHAMPRCAWRNLASPRRACHASPNTIVLRFTTPYLALPDRIKPATPNLIERSAVIAIPCLASPDYAPPGPTLPAMPFQAPPGLDPLCSTHPSLPNHTSPRQAKPHRACPASQSRTSPE